MTFEVCVDPNNDIYLLARFVKNPYKSISHYDMVTWAQKIETIILGIEYEIENNTYADQYMSADDIDEYNYDEEYVAYMLNDDDYSSDDDF